MTDPKDAIRQRIDKGLEDLKSVSDEIRVRLHLASMDAKETWKKLEPRINKVQEQARGVKDDVADSVSEALDELRQAARDLKAKIAK